MNSEIKKFSIADELAENLTNEFQPVIEELSITRKTINICISGGSTPNIFFRKLANYNRLNKKKIPWDIIHVFWVDERCVPPNHPDSNFGTALKYLLKPVELDPENIHRIKGERNPEEEIESYAEELRDNVDLAHGFPRFDWIFLGIGEDGHTASIFPHKMDLLYSSKFCDIAEHPETGQKRITLTGKVLINAKRVTFIVSGENKKKVIADIISGNQESKKYPASYIKPVGGKLSWYLDVAASSML
jgi:6-phosphogluconolactonase